jgi:hypothetical protein
MPRPYHEMVMWFASEIDVNMWYASQLISICQISNEEAIYPNKYEFQDQNHNHQLHSISYSG